MRSFQHIFANKAVVIKLLSFILLSANIWCGDGEGSDFICKYKNELFLERHHEGDDEHDVLEQQLGRQRREREGERTTQQSGEVHIPR